MMKRKFLFLLAASIALGAWAQPAAADPTAGPPICASAGQALAGSYGNLTVAGNSYVAAGTTLTVRGNLRLAPGACMDAFTLGTVNVGGNVNVGRGATLALGCTPQSLGDPTAPPCFATTTHDTVGGNLVADQPLTMYLDGDTIRGSVVSNGGGPGLGTRFLNFPVKDNAIGGNLVVQGWQGGWSGAIRNTVGGNVVFSRNESITDLDSNEVQTNTITGNLVCLGNSPAAQVNAGDGGQPNDVGGNKVGQCEGL